MNKQNKTINVFLAGTTDDSIWRSRIQEPAANVFLSPAGAASSYSRQDFDRMKTAADVVVYCFTARQIGCAPVAEMIHDLHRFAESNKQFIIAVLPKDDGYMMTKPVTASYEKVRELAMAIVGPSKVHFVSSIDGINAELDLINHRANKAPLPTATAFGDEGTYRFQQVAV